MKTLNLTQRCVMTIDPDIGIHVHGLGNKYTISGKKENIRSLSKKLT